MAPWSSKNTSTPGSMQPPSLPDPSQVRRSTRTKVLTQRGAAALNLDDTSPPSSETSSQRKRKRADSELLDCTLNPAPDSEAPSSTASTRFPASVKQEIEKLCGHKDQCLINLPHLHVAANGMPLCPACHKAFDNDANPGWVFFPQDLEFFIEFEKRDYARRLEEQRTKGALPSRQCPSSAAYREHQKNIIRAADHGGLYNAVMLYNYQSPDLAYRPGPSPYLQQPKSWHGDPMAAIDTARRGLGALPIIFPKAFVKLISLYGKHDYAGPPLPWETVDPDRFSGSSSASESSEEDQQGVKGGKNVPRGQSAKGQLVKKNAGSSQQPTVSGTKPSKQRQHSKRMMRQISERYGTGNLAVNALPPSLPHIERSPWRYGPLSTAQEAIDFKTDVLKIPITKVSVSSNADPSSTSPTRPKTSTTTRGTRKVTANMKKARASGKTPTASKQRVEQAVSSTGSTEVSMKLHNNKRVMLITYLTEQACIRNHSSRSATA
ncbi:MAG: hypothetical protein Q9211_000017 [Gyalolechia sp. 1 TL-2023]